MITTCLRGETLEMFKPLDMEGRLDFEAVKNKFFSAFSQGYDVYFIE